MKRLITLLLAFIVVIGCCACQFTPDFGGNTGDGDNTTNNGGDNTTGGENNGGGTGGNQNAQADSLSGLQEGTFPNVKITFTAGTPLTKEDDYKECVISTDNCVAEQVITDAIAEVKIRGNSTSRADKKPYRIKFDKKQSMLGLNEGQKYKSWVLLADAYDYAMSRNYFIFGVAKVFNRTYCTDRRYVNVYINGAYNGVYLLCEQNQVNEGRVEVDEDNVETSVNTGYFIEADTRAAQDGCILFNGETSPTDIVPGSDYYFEVTYKGSRNSVTKNKTQQFTVKSDLSSDQFTAWQQLRKISDYMQAVYDALFDYYDETYVRSLIDIDSAVDMFIINNIASLRGGKRSDYYYIDFTDAKPRLHFGPPWDYDLDCGNYEGDFDKPNKFNALTVSDYVNYTLNQRSWFVEEVKARWQAVGGKSALLSLLEEVHPTNANAVCKKFKGEFDRNYTKWNIWGTHTEKLEGFQNDILLTFTSHTDAVWHFYNWMKPHLDYAQSEWGR